MLPQTPGYYFWYILDWGYFEIGAVQVMQDTEKHLKYLADAPSKKSFYVYKNDEGVILTMYHKAAGTGKDNFHYPPSAEDGKPYVDGYVPFDFQELLNRTLK
jgi:hypothetical protein